MSDNLNCTSHSKKSIEWVKRRWFDLRSGHNFYLAFMMAVMNFVIISYALVLERVPVLNTIFPSMWIWIFFFIAVYIPASIMIGYFHKHTQLPTDQTEFALHNPVTMFQMKRLDEIAESIEKICQRLDIQGVEITRWKDFDKGELNRNDLRIDEKSKTS